MSDPSGSTTIARESVLKPSDALPANAVHIVGPDLSSPVDLGALLGSYETIGFQATGLAKAIKVVEEMVSVWGRGKRGGEASRVSRLVARGGQQDNTPGCGVWVWVGLCVWRVSSLGESLVQMRSSRPCPHHLGGYVQDPFSSELDS
jgi:deoxyhypusine synthase